MVHHEDFRGFGYRKRRLKRALMFTYSFYLYDVVDWFSRDVVFAIDV